MVYFLQILLFSLASAFGLIAFLTWNYIPKDKPYSLIRPSARKEDCLPPKLFHVVAAAGKLSPVALAQLDSISRVLQRKDAKDEYVVKLHIMAPADAATGDLAAIQLKLDRQLEQLIKIGGLNIQVLIEADFVEASKGTPFEDIANIIGSNRIMGTTEGAKLPNGRQKRTAIAHASDLFRLLALWKDGGIYLDTDMFLLDDPFPMLAKYGSFVVCNSDLDAPRDGRCGLVNSPMAFCKPKHDFVGLSMHHAANKIKSVGPARVFPQPELGMVWRSVWGVTGPESLSLARDDWMNAGRDTWVASTIKPDEWKLEPPKGGEFPAATRVSSDSLTIIGRRLFSPSFYRGETVMLGDATQKSVDMFRGAYAFHLWEGSNAQRSGEVKNNFVKHINVKKGLMIEYLFNRTCNVWCDANSIPV